MLPLKSHEITRETVRGAKPRSKKQVKFEFSMKGSQKGKYILDLEYIPFLMVV